MHNHVKVEFLPSRIPASDDTIARRTEVGQGLDNLGHIDATAGDINTTEVRWVARIGGAEMEALDFSIQKLDDGRVAVSLVAVVDAVSIGDENAAVMTAVPVDEEEDAEETRRRVVEERLAFADQATHDHTLDRWTCGCDPVLTGIQDAARATGRINVTTMHLGAQVARNAEVGA
jgi:hypothetical protein